MTFVASLDFQPEERDVGISAGYNVDGDAPDEVLEEVADQATQRRIDEFEEHGGRRRRYAGRSWRDDY